MERSTEESRLKRLSAYWGDWRPLTFLLLPLTLLFCLLVGLRRWGYRSGLLGSSRLPVPVVVVGNISVGGTGKTPLVIWLAQWLRQRGWRPGILTRGYGGRAGATPREVTADRRADEVGDEAVLLRRRAACPVYVGSRRVESGRRLLAQHPCDILIADDGLQHYALRRDLELLVIDGERRFGNGLCLPAGPLREPVRRLRSTDLRVCNGAPGPGEYAMQVAGDRAFPLKGNAPPRRLSEFIGSPVVAVAGIGNPGRFFAMLEAAGLEIRPHAFPDHHRFSAEDLAPFHGSTVLMTEKDAVKCELFANDSLWYIPAVATLEPPFIERLEPLIDRLKDG